MVLPIGFIIQKLFEENQNIKDLVLLERISLYVWCRWICRKSALCQNYF